MGNKKYYIILWFAVACFMYHCSSDNSIIIKGFNQTTWLLDSLGCMQARKSMAKVLENNMEIFSGHSSSELKALLGSPNIIHEREGVTIYTYFLEPGHQCRDKNWKEKGYTECLQMLFFIERDKIKMADIIYP